MSHSERISSSSSSVSVSSDFVCGLLQFAVDRHLQKEVQDNANACHEHVCLEQAFFALHPHATTFISCDGATSDTPVRGEGILSTKSHPKSEIYIRWRHLIR